MAGRPLSLLCQVQHIKRWNREVATHIDRHEGRARLRFTLHMRPTESSDTYEVLFRYSLGSAPSIRMVNPRVVTAAHGKKTPHLYQGDLLCVYDPKRREWTPDMPIITTIVPWTSRWLAHYENFLAFGDYNGNHPNEVPPTGPDHKEPPSKEAA